MTPLAILLMAAAAASQDGPPTEGQPGGVERVAARVQARVLRPAIVRQSSGLEPGREGPAPQISRRGPAVLIEFQ